jgi:cob(I)alamin adenosyltransferase
MKIYTRTGDDGTTSLSNGRKIPKHHNRVEAYGSVDELIAWIGLLRDLDTDKKRKDLLVYIQDQLMRCAATLASGAENEKNKKYIPEAGSVSVIEREIDRMEVDMPSLRNFILPGGHIIISYCHIVRCVCRRAERAVLRLNETDKTPEIVVKFLNRLSDFLFVLARKIGSELDIEQIKWPL